MSVSGHDIIDRTIKNRKLHPDISIGSIDDLKVTFGSEASSHRDISDFIKHLYTGGTNTMFSFKTDSYGKKYIQANYDLFGIYGIRAYSTTEVIIPGLWDTMPVASDVMLGGVKVGTGIDVDIDGVISVNTNISNLDNYYTKTQSDGRYSQLGHAHSILYTGDGLTGNNYDGTTNVQWSVSASILSQLTDLASMFELKTDGTTNYIQAKLDLFGQKGMRSYSSTEVIVPSIWEEMPIASDVMLGGVKVGSGLSIDINGVLSVDDQGGVSSWNDLTDRPGNLLSIAGLSYTVPAYIKMTGFETFDLEPITSMVNVTENLTVDYLPVASGASSLKNSVIKHITGGIEIAGNIHATGDIVAFASELAPPNWWDNLVTEVQNRIDLNHIKNVNVPSPSDGYVLTYDLTNTVWIPTASSGIGSYWTKSGTNIYYNDGNVAIGSTDPGAYNLHVTGIAYVSSYIYTRRLALSISNTSVQTNNVAPLIYRTGDGTNPYPFNAIGHLVIQPRSDIGRDIVFMSGNPTPSVRMVIDSAGKVGIGTDSPAHALHVHNETGSQYIRVSRGAATASYLLLSAISGRTRLYSRTPADAALPMDFMIGATVEMNISSTGLSIGNTTTVAAAPLHIMSGSWTALRLDRPTVSGVAIDFYNSSGMLAQINAEATGGLWLRPTASAGGSALNGIFLRNTDNIGIGLTNPINKLEILGNTSLHFGHNSDLATNRWEITKYTTRYLYGTSDVETAKIAFLNYNIEGTGWFNVEARRSAGISLYTIHANSQIEAVTILSGGNVGIRTITPAHPLHVTGDTLVTGTLSVGAHSSAYAIYAVKASHGIYSQTTSSSGGVYGFRVRTGADQYAFGVMGDGRVGIGTAAPGSPLEVRGASSSSIFRINSLSGTTGMLLLSNGTSLGHFWGTTNYVAIGIGNTVSSMFFNISTGNIGINNTAPQQKFEVAGNIMISYPSEPTIYNMYITPYVVGDSRVGYRFITKSSIGGTTTPLQFDNIGNVTVGGNLSATGEVTAYSSSDIRLKTLTGRVENAMDIICKLNPITFLWNDKAVELNNNKSRTVKQYGLIAQELEQVLPELVHPIYRTYKGIDYEKLIPIMIGALKEQNDEIKELKKELANLN